MDGNKKYDALAHLSTLCPKGFSQKRTINAEEINDVYHRVRTGSLSQQQVNINFNCQLV